MDVNFNENIFIPVTGSDVMLKNGTTFSISTKYMVITIMEKFKNKSFEELRLENYNTKVLGFGKPNGNFSISNQTDTDNTVINENNQLNVIKDLVDELVNTLCKLMLKMNTAFNPTPCVANETQASNSSGSFPSAGIKITPSFNHSSKFDPFLTNCAYTFTPTPLIPTKPSTEVTNFPKFNCTPSTNNFSFTPTTNPFFNTTKSPTSTITTTCVSSSFINSIFAPKESFFDKTLTTETKTSASNPPFHLPTTTSSGGFTFNPTTSYNSTFQPSNTTPSISTSSSFFNTTSTTQSKSLINRPPFLNHSCWSTTSATSDISNKTKLPSDNPFTQPMSPFFNFNVLPSTNFNYNAKKSVNFVKSNSNSENINSFQTQTPHTSLFKPNLSTGKSSSTSLFSTKKAESISSTSNRIETIKKQELNDDEFVSSIVDCIESLKTITLEAQKSKLIGICEIFDTNKSHILESAFVQLRVMNLRFFNFKKCAYIGESAGITNTTIKNNILGGKPFNAQLYYSAIVLCCLKEDIDSLPLGDSTQVGDNAVELSDVQKQKIAFARAFYADQNIYFFYNAFSKINSKDARFIFESLILGALKEKVIILMNDKPSYFSHCDKIYILNKGKIVEEGNHNALLDTNDFYASTVKKNDFNSVVTEATAINDQSSNAKENSIASVSQSNNTLEIISPKFHDIQVQTDKYAHNELNEVIQQKVVDDIETKNTLERQIENNECSKKFEVKESNQQYSTYIRKDNQTGIIETKIFNQQDDNQEKQLDNPAENENDLQTSSVNVEKDEIEKKF